ncbi:hypothetical protein F0562_021712 [Nyssa sinensis]|uniref:Pentacotripeptide-repeat region of PRORP domain-containing protein n=1 Tax=Nyssa sinensis TaxID=561372 RepID=A0A5J5BP96_9ASTE|nr:hypothetical protein F0562_021712 [Nyssa sinensis]
MSALDDMREIGFRINYPCYSTLLMCLAKLDMGFPAFLVYRRMVGDGFVAGIIDYKNVINALSKNAFVQATEMFFSRVLKLGLGFDTHICTSLVLGCCRLGDLQEAFRVFEIMSKEDGCNPNSVTYSILIHGLCEAGRLDEAFQLKEEMSEKGCQPSTRTYTILIKAICDAGFIDKALGLLDEMVTKGCKPNVHTYTVLICKLCGEGKIEEANGMFRKMLKDGLFPGTVTYNALINGYCKEGMVVSAFELLSVMERRNCKPSIRTYNELMEGLCRVNRSYKAMLLLGKVINNGLWPDRVSYNILVDGFSKEGQLNMAFNMLNSMNSVGIEPDCFTFTSLINGLCKQGRPEQANGLLGLMVKKGISPDEVTFTALIDGYCKIGFIMSDKAIEAGVVSYNGDLDVQSLPVGGNGDDLFSNHVFREMDVGHAFKLRDKMEECGGPTVDLYNMLVMGLCKVGRMSEAEHIIQDMVRHGLFPDKAVCSFIIEQFCKERKYDYCLEFMKLILNNGFLPSFESYCSMILGLRNEGKIQEARRLISDLLRSAGIEDKTAISTYLEFLVKEDEPHKCLELLDLIEKMHHKERPII